MMSRIFRWQIAVLMIAAVIACAAKAGPSLVGTWKYNRLVLMFDADGSCQQINLGSGEEDGGKYKVQGAKLDIDFDSGRALRFNYRIQGGTLRLTDVVVGNTIELHPRAVKPLID